MTGARILVPVRDSSTLRNTVAYAATTAAESDSEPRPTIHFVYPVSQRITPGQRPADAEELLGRVEAWIEEDLAEYDADVGVETGFVAEGEYLFNPRDYADVLGRYARENAIETVVLDPEFNPLGMTPLLPPLETELERAGLDAEVAPVDRPTRRFPIVRRASLGQFVVLFGWAFGFYLVIAGSLAPFELATGAISGLVVAGLLWRISLSGFANVGRLVGRLVRMGLYAPLLVWEIAKANVQIAYVVLHPDLPIDPEVVEFDAAVWSELPVTTLANSITLTPGTLTVDVNRQKFTVHALTTDSREDLLDGGLERAVRFVFYGRSAADIPSPAERAGDSNDTETTTESDTT
ncbi:monovalent cation/H+ antiporter subunit E [Halorussus salilacus]|uniref:monovalent cation/H+ antiporter subunit E n=1 Tax=Halorussus salilacus TaxID=2953750 RepID=UPI00209CFD4D|nr:monovalent cation/H+ antiporter subunit E [Halorussus salilacus]USZ68677.1 monovalent cation/H+ antiporter subunit E [Halorussus salilacus]